jgi:hypothetical protein
MLDMDTATHWIERALVAVGLVLSGAAGCGLFDDAQTDGEVCEVDDDCSTGVCTSYALCSHTGCDCPSGNCAEAGEVTSECLDGWRCVSVDSIFDPVTEPITEFFGGKVDEHSGYCQPVCEGGCPDHYVCDGDGVFCSPDEAWVYPVPTVVWSGDAAGELSGRDQTLTVMVEEGSTITLTGTGSSPRGEIVGYSWETVSSAADFMNFEGQTIETTVPPGDFRRVDFTITDDAARTGMLSVTFEACLGPGATCLFEGSGCCSDSCDDASNTCL